MPRAIFTAKIRLDQKQGPKFTDRDGQQCLLIQKHRDGYLVRFDDGVELYALSSELKVL